MIGIIDTIRGLSEWIEENFGEPPTTKDLLEGFDRPCTYIQPVEMSTSKESQLRVDEYTIEIIRFSEQSYDGYLELLDYQEKFTDLLEQPVPVSDSFLLYPEEVTFELDREDMALLVSFDVQNIQLVEDVITAPDMLELELEQE